jgi:hypothetical protein
MDKNTLLSKLQSLQKEAKNAKKKSINTEASFETLTAEEITLVLAHRAKKLRIENELKQSQFSKHANLSSSTTYANFEQTGKISLINFVKVCQAFGRIAELDSLLKSSISSEIDKIEGILKEKKRVR